MIALKNVSFEYNSIERSAGVYDINLEIPSGQVLMLCGASGCGKTTITRLINGLAPAYYPGNLRGKLLIDGADSFGLTLYELSQKIGSVFQNPRSQFFSVDSSSEIAFGCENTGVEREEMYRRIGQVARDLHMESLPPLPATAETSCPAERSRGSPVLLSQRCSRKFSSWMSPPPIWIFARSSI